jgi:hypothetical protein
MFEEFLRLVVYVPIDEASGGSGLATASVTSVQEIMRVLLEFDFAGSVGTYKAVAEISSGAETFMPTGDSAPIYGRAGTTSTVPSAQVVTYIPVGTPDQDVDRMVGAVVSAHPSMPFSLC